MKGTKFLSAVLLFLLVFFLITIAKASNIQLRDKKTATLETFSKLSLYFIKNRGQIDKKVKYYAQSGEKAIYFTQNGVYTALTNISKKNKNKLLSRETIFLKPVNANSSAVLTAEQPLSGKVNYFIGNKQNKWKRCIPTYQRIVYKNIYPNIDIAFYGNQSQLEYDIVVKPGAKLSDIKFKYEGIKSLTVNKHGELVAELPSGEKLIQRKPIIYQKVGSKKIEIKGNYKISKENGEYFFSFNLKNYDKKYPIVIDPVLNFSTYFGSTQDDYGLGIVVDTKGFIYITGDTDSPNFPNVNAYQKNYSGGASDVFIAKFSPSGELIYSTFLGGMYGDYSHGGISVDSNGNVYLTGYTSSSDFPTKNAYQAYIGGYDDAFVAKLNASGDLVYSTYIGGSSGDGGKGIVVDSNGNAYVTGYTESEDFPTKNAYQAHLKGIYDAFLLKLSPSGDLLYSTYIGGSKEDIANSIALDLYGNIYIVGDTLSTDFPTENAYQTNNAGDKDAFIAKFSPSGGLVYSTYFGGSSGDEGDDIAIDSNGYVYITGFTLSDDFPVKNAFQKNFGGYSDVFISKFNPSGGLNYSTYFGGSGNDTGKSLAIDALGNVYVTGMTDTENLTTTENAFQNAYNGNPYDAFLIKINSSGTLVYSTYIGGNNSDIGNAISVNSNGDIYIIGNTSSSDFPTKNPYQANYNGGWMDAFVMVFSKTASNNDNGGGNSPPTFSDISPTDWFYTYVQDIAKAGITTGYPDGTYKPSALVTRAQMATFIARALKLNIPNQCNSSPFYDVDTNTWYCKYVEAIKSAGITTGYPDGSYKPDGYVTRAEMAAFLVKALHLNKQPCTTKPFVDVPTDAWYCPYVQAIKNAGITSGYPDGTYRPNEAVTRAIMAAFIDKAFLMGSPPQPTAGTLKWKYKIGGDVFASPAIAEDGTVYIGSQDGYLYALDKNGHFKWKFETSDVIDSSAAIGPDGTIYVGSLDGCLYSITPNGTLKWKYETESKAEIESVPAIGKDGTIYFGSNDNNLYALSQNGTLKWKYATGGQIWSSPVIGNDGTIYFGSFDRNIYALYPNGTLKWKYATGKQIWSPPALGSDGTIYIGSLDKNLYAIAPDGTLKWKYPTGMEIVSSPAIDSDETIYVGSMDGNLYALNPDGTLKWKYATGDGISSSPSIASDGTIYVGSADKNIYAINSNGTLQWKYATGDQIAWSSPAIGNDGTVYIGSTDGYLYAIVGSAPLANSPWPMFHHDEKHTGALELTSNGNNQGNTPNSGTLKWAFATNRTIYDSAAIASDGTVYIGSADNNLYALNPDGSLKWKFTTGDYIVSSPSIAPDGTIYIGSGDHDLYALRPDGTLKWKFTTGDSIRATAAIGSDGTIYVGSGDANLYALRPDGTLKWKYETYAALDSSPAIAPDGTIYVASWSSYIYAFRPDGTLKWKYEAYFENISSSPAIGADGTIYVGTRENNLYALKPDGTLKWKFATEDSIRSSPTIGTDGTIYVGSEDGYMYAINPDGSLKWKFSTASAIGSSDNGETPGAYIDSTPAIGSDGTIYVGAFDGSIYAISPNGQLKWKYTTPEPIESDPTIGSDGTVYIGSGDGKLYAIVGSAPLANSPWPMFHHDEKHTGRQ